ncbi:hypothetical protein M9H77_26310 [Catharanthus roseus]|uniref:Uncharacterized protein n=1 Tax=Catharanthus roseus TaxID=4058 RepID=A0ACC0AAN6_CATRO|nr:hypothetical protein M9H77_26310 [Catharanthus roseus]
MFSFLYTKSRNATFLSVISISPLCFCNWPASVLEAIHQLNVCTNVKIRFTLFIWEEGHMMMYNYSLPPINKCSPVSSEDSEEATAESMAYSYRYGFSGFAARLTKSQARKINYLKSLTSCPIVYTRSWDYLGVSLNSPYGLFHDSKMGNDDNLGPTPKRWKGICQSGVAFTSTNCNNKLIGAHYFFKGVEAEYGPIDATKDYLSPRDKYGPGTHTSSTAGTTSIMKN